MGKAKREEKRARRDAELEQQRQAAERHARRRFWLAFIPVLAGAVAVVSYLVLDSAQLAGIALLAGALVWLPFALSHLGSQVKPRDRKNAGSIDFGGRR